MLVACSMDCGPYRRLRPSVWRPHPTLNPVISHLNLVTGAVLNLNMNNECTRVELLGIEIVSLKPQS